MILQVLAIPANYVALYSLLSNQNVLPGIWCCVVEGFWLFPGPTCLDSGSNQFLLYLRAEIKENCFYYSLLNP